MESLWKASKTIPVSYTHLIQNGTWAATTSKQMGEILGTMKNIHLLEADVTIKSALKNDQEAELDELADAIAA